VKTKELQATVDATSDKSIVAKITTESLDRDGEVLVPQGMNAKEYMSNPILFWNHDYTQPIGRVSKIKRGSDAVYGTLEFAQRPKDYEGEFFPQFAETLVKQGIVKGVSVGFIPEEGGMRVATKSDRDKYGNKCKKVFNQWKLLEVSLAPLPANQDALIEAVGKGLVTAIGVKKFLGIQLPKSPCVNHIKLHRPNKKYILELVDSSERIERDEIQKAVRAEVGRARGQLWI
tara:strand:- start:699 stop:1391 length:693 start_codon:yes stop_codon:yes gene_type:complete